MSYVLRHTAEELDHKLDLIDINRNLLPYPYNTTFPTGIEDTGDGSILATAYSSSEKTVFLTADVLLPAGTYTASVETTDGIDTDKVVENPGFALVIVDNKDTTNEITINAAGQFVLTDTTVIKVSLAIPDSFNPGIVIKPQIEVGLAKTPWTPYMKSIGSYVDERFNSTNTKIKALAESIADMPSPEVDLSNVLTIAYGEGSAAEGENSRAAGTNAVAISKNTQADGNNTFAGCRGYYWNAINFEAKKIYLSKEQTIPMNAETAVVLIEEFTDSVPEYISLSYDISDPYIRNVSGHIDYEYTRNNEIRYVTINFTNGVIPLVESDRTDSDIMYHININNMFNEVLDAQIPANSSVMGWEINSGSLVQPSSDYVDSSFTPDYAVGDKIAIVNSNKYFSSATISKIVQNVITYNGDIGFKSINTVDPDEFDLDDYSIYVVEKPAPEADVDPENRICKSIKRDAHAEGHLSKATGNASHAEGTATNAYGDHAHAEGSETKAAWAAHSEGSGTTASGFRSHAEGTGTISSGASSHAEGTETQATNYDAHAEGYNSIASGSAAHVEGDSNKASGSASHAEGRGTEASGSYAHTEGIYTRAGNLEKGTAHTNKGAGNFTHAEGNGTLAKGNSSHAEGISSESLGLAAHAEGNSTTASGQASHSEGTSTTASGPSAHSEGNSTTASGDSSHAEGHNTQATKTGSHAEGQDTQATGDKSHAEGTNSQAIGHSAHAEGYGSFAGGTTAPTGSGATDQGFFAHAEGNGSWAYGNSSHAEGWKTQANGAASHSEGYTTTANGEGSHSEGYVNTANGKGSHAEGSNNTIVTAATGSHIEGLSNKILAGEGTHAEGRYTKIGGAGTGSHTEGTHTKVNGYSGHAEGYGTLVGAEDTENDLVVKANGTVTDGYFGHAEGVGTQAKGAASHAEGKSTLAIGLYSHAGGLGTKATANAQTAIGIYNDVDNDALFIVGNGTDDTDSGRSNAFVVKKDGTAYSGEKQLATIDYVDSQTSSEATLQSLGIKASAQELNYVAGITSNVQEQLNNKANTDHTHDLCTYLSYGSIGGGATSLNEHTIGTGALTVWSGGPKVKISDGNITSGIFGAVRYTGTFREQTDDYAIFDLKDMYGRSPDYDSFNNSIIFVTNDSNFPSINAILFGRYESASSVVGDNCFTSNGAQLWVSRAGKEGNLGASYIEVIVWQNSSAVGKN